MKKFIIVMLVAIMTLSFTGCGSRNENNDMNDEVDNTAVSYDDIADVCESEDGIYQIAMVTDVGQLKDSSFNQNTWNGVKKYAFDNEKTYKYYQPANGYNSTDEDRIDAMTEACMAGAEIVVAPGTNQQAALSAVAPKFPEVQFVFVDGFDLGLENLVGVSYQEEQAGYLAGYAAVMEGYTKLGFSGGGGGSNPACNRYGYGYCQGVNDAATEKNITVEMRYSWDYGTNFQASDDLTNMITEWYDKGTEIVFMCGGSMFKSGVAAAEKSGGAIIGADVDQSSLSDTVVTSAMKELASSVQRILGTFYSDGLQSGTLLLGAADNMIGLPTNTWTFENWTVEDYSNLLQRIVSGDITVSNDSGINDPSAVDLDNIRFIH